MQIQTLFPLGQIQALGLMAQLQAAPHPFLLQQNFRQSPAVVQIINGGTFTFTQAIPSAVWVINHPFVNQHPSVTIVDPAGNEVQASVQYTPNQDQVIIRFAQPFAGTAYLNA